MKRFERVFLIGDDYEFRNIFAGIEVMDIVDKGEKKPFVRKQTPDNKNLIILTGFSKANAGAASQYVLDHYKAKEYINMGLVGSLSDEFSRGDTVMVSECRSYDTDFGAFGYELGQIPQTPIYRYNLKVWEAGLPKVKIVSGDRFVTDRRVLENIFKVYDPDCVEVELATIAHVFYRNGKLDSLISVRAISDKADKVAPTDFYDTPEFIFGKTNLWLKKFVYGDAKIWG
jgi:5'-methylthioadenosine/S-adenosylhomocysteine nucleosidase